MVDEQCAQTKPFSNQTHHYGQFFISSIWCVKFTLDKYNYFILCHSMNLCDEV